MSAHRNLDTESITCLLRAIAKGHGVDLDVQAVPDIQAWCAENGVPENNPFRIGMALANLETGRPLILLANPITPTMIGSVIGGMIYRGFGDRAETLREPGKFVHHLLLHELAHLLDPERTEEKCDEWAFKQME